MVLACKCSAKVTVHVKNDIQGYQVVLDYHCFNDNDDLGQRLLHQGQEWHWEFGVVPAFTFFVCDMRWYDNKDHRWYDGKFDVYYTSGFLGNKFKRFCGGDCQWSIRRDGAYLYRKDRSDWERRGEWH
ncbi:S-protein homolog 2-like [Papaver somniferum]|uniref:S-protein homolog 2-like n=1 Tax=Papaver somniferum TaxID=3469 RepID=UPI000E6FC8EF|nr:S-protein homolog 2-like [Papaver somniferum]